ncbi:MAG: hypothetical protein IPL49_14170 [Saprospirales bacterium]|nr:hypothetical protein [Saprospirales bacterium]MBK8491991.1 hypothetical protein [Saprospirales bacterium]
MIAATHLHAMVVHFPIALLIAGFLAEVIALFAKNTFFRKAGLFLLLLGTAGAIAAYFSGEAAGDGMEEGALGRALGAHEQAAVITLWIALAASAMRIGGIFLKKEYTWFRVLEFSLYVLAIAAVSLTGFRGGELVFKHAAGVELALPDFSTSEPE